MHEKLASLHLTVIFSLQFVGIFSIKNAKHLDLEILTYDELADQLAIYCDGFSGADIAGITRAAASRALARSVGRLSGDDLASEDDASSYSIMDCLVTQDDFYQAINAVRGRSGTSDNVVDDEGENDRQESSRGGFRSQLRQRIRSWTKKNLYQSQSDLLATLIHDDQ